MKSITLYSHVGSDGILQLQLPDELKNRDVTVIVRPKQPEWLSVLEKTAGKIPDLERSPINQTINFLAKTSSPFKFRSCIFLDNSPSNKFGANSQSHLKMTEMHIQSYL
jgi:hypothetical protein